MVHSSFQNVPECLQQWPHHTFSVRLHPWYPVLEFPHWEAENAFLYSLHHLCQYQLCRPAGKNCLTVKKKPRFHRQNLLHYSVCCSEAGLSHRDFQVVARKFHAPGKSHADKHFFHLKHQSVELIFLFLFSALKVALSGSQLFVNSSYKSIGLLRLHIYYQPQSRLRLTHPINPSSCRTLTQPLCCSRVSNTTPYSALPMIS